MNAYLTNRNWSDRFLPEIKRLVGKHLLEIAPDPFGHFQATDLMMLEARDMRIAARIRRPGYCNLCLRWKRGCTIDRLDLRAKEMLVNRQSGLVRSHPFR